MRERLTEKIVFEELIVSENINGFDEKKWMEYHPCWASKQDMSGREFMSQRADSTEVITTFRTRCSLKIRNIVENYLTRQFRVKYKGDTYDIIYTYDVKNKHKEIEFKCKLVK